MQHWIQEIWRQQFMTMKVAEFFSGIGGMHCALEKADVAFEIIAAFDINTSANQVYKHNFPKTPIMQKNIQALEPEFLDKLNADLWTMSPPCQPFTRQGKKLDLKDARTSGFQNIMRVLTEMKSPPTAILLENVKGFEISEAKEQFVQVLEQLNYNFQDFLLTPSQFGIPNSRLRYYLLAVRSEDFKTKPNIQTELNGFPNNPSCSELNSYLDDSLKSEDFSELLLPKNVLGKQAEVLDIVTPESTGSCCFTRAYGHYAEGTGSVLYSGDKVMRDQAFVTSRDKETFDEKAAVLQPLALRYFSPKEIANLMGFPPSYCKV